MEKQTEALTPGKGDLVRIEREMMRLTRILEAHQRKRPPPLERAEYIILRTLIESGPQGIGHLARQLLLDDSTMTRQIAALQEKGLVERRPDPTDGRASIVAATVTGAEKADAMLDVRLTRTGQYLHGWSDRERSVFGELLERFNAALVASLGE